MDRGLFFLGLFCKAGHCGTFCDMEMARGLRVGSFCAGAKCGTVWRALAWFFDGAVENRGWLGGRVDVKMGE
jgi:hypothetical protein